MPASTERPGSSSGQRSEEKLIHDAEVYNEWCWCFDGLGSVCLFLCVKVLPPLRDVMNRPEVGDALRNKLVRLMTNIDTDVKDCAAEFLFVLCKESGEFVDSFLMIENRVLFNACSLNHTSIVTVMFSPFSCEIH